MNLLRSLCGVAAVVVTLASPTTSAADKIPDTPFERHYVKDASGRDITYYLNRPRIARAHLLLMIQGSGCTPVIVEQKGERTYSTVFGLMPFGGEGQFAVMAVEKPHSGQAKEQAPSTARGCSEAFNEDFTAESWLVALQAALSDAIRDTAIDASRILVIGTSEGGVMASLLASHNPRITDVAVLGGSGTTQLFDFIENSYRHCFDASACLDDVGKQLAAIRSDPQSATQFAWGHPYKRWTSFFGVDPSEELLKSRARVYWALGTADESVPPASQEVAIAKLMVAGRDLTVRRVPNAAHSLMPPGSRDYADLDKEMRTVLKWFEQGKQLPTFNRDNQPLSMSALGRKATFGYRPEADVESALGHFILAGGANAIGVRLRRDFLWHATSITQLHHAVRRALNRSALEPFARCPEEKRVVALHHRGVR